MARWRKPESVTSERISSVSVSDRYGYKNVDRGGTTEPSQILNGSGGNDDRSGLTCRLHDVPKQTRPFQTDVGTRFWFRELWWWWWIDDDGDDMRRSWFILDLDLSVFVWLGVLRDLLSVQFVNALIVHQILNSYTCCFHPIFTSGIQTLCTFLLLLPLKFFFSTCFSFLKRKKKYVLIKKKKKYVIVAGSDYLIIWSFQWGIIIHKSCGFIIVRGDRYLEWGSNL